MVYPPPPQDHQDLPAMAHLGPKSYLQVSSEKLKKNMTSMWNLCLKKWVFVQKWHFLLKKWDGFTPPGTPRFAKHGSFGPQILPSILLGEIEKKYDLHVTLEPNVPILDTKKRTFCKSDFVIPLQDPQFLMRMAHMGLTPYLNVPLRFRKNI